MMADEGLGGEFHVLDARLMDFQSTADVAICLCEGAFGLAGSDAAHRQVLDNVYRALRPGGRLVLSAINTPHVVQHLAGDDRFDANTGTIRDDEVIVGSDGLERQVTIYTTTFSFRELRLLLERSGFEVMAGYGCNVGHFERKPLTVDDVEIMMVARKA
jgi:SAM-dependent methyltransferase